MPDNIVMQQHTIRLKTHHQTTAHGGTRWAAVGVYKWQQTHSSSCLRLSAISLQTLMNDESVNLNVHICHFIHSEAWQAFCSLHCTLVSTRVSPAATVEQIYICRLELLTPNCLPLPCLRLAVKTLCYTLREYRAERGDNLYCCSLSRYFLCLDLFASSQLLSSKERPK